MAIEFGLTNPNNPVRTQELTALGNRRMHHEDMPEAGNKASIEDLDARGTAYAFRHVPVGEIPHADGWDRLPDTHGVVDGLSYTLSGHEGTHGFYKL